MVADGDAKSIHVLPLVRFIPREAKNVTESDHTVNHKIVKNAAILEIVNPVVFEYALSPPQKNRTNELFYCNRFAQSAGP